MEWLQGWAFERVLIMAGVLTRKIFSVGEGVETSSLDIFQIRLAKTIVNAE